MTAYFRKALTFGPFRLNLSKSGLGLSVGITGLRVGIGPTGPYFHAGKGGLYFRKSLKDIDNTNECIAEETEETPAEPQSIWKKIYIYAANFLVGALIVSVLITILCVYFFVDFLKFAGSKKRKPKINRKSK